MIETKVGKKTIFFNEDKHRFTDEVGNKIDSVTTFTGVIDKSGALIGWAVKLFKNYLADRIENGEQITSIDIEEGAKQHRLRKEEAADIGTQIHELVSLWIKGKKFEIPEDERVQNGFNAFLKFQREHKMKWLESEKIVYSTKHNYAGILDGIAFSGKDRILVDFKSSNGIYSEAYFQTAGYQIAYEEMTKHKISHRVIVRFGKNDGEFEFRELKNNVGDKKAFLACLELKRRLKDIEKE
jgi:hypothetical protein